jgi:hypothetical protein
MQFDSTGWQDAARFLDRHCPKVAFFCSTLRATHSLLNDNWIALRWIILENAGAWAAAAGLLHGVPYLGPGVTALAMGMAAFMQFQSFAVALLVAGATLGVATLVGTLATTWMTGRFTPRR